MRDVVGTMARILTLRISREELLALDRRHLAAGLICTWVAGMGRYWDDPRAVWAQTLGLGSVAYVFVLSALLWAVVAPFLLERWRYRDVLTFVTLTSPPALLYAIPVEQMTDMRSAAECNAWFLLLVASWRVALWFFYLVRFARLGWFAAGVCELLPLCLIVVGLTMLNLEHATVDMMSGIRTSKDSSYLLVGLLAGLGVLLFIPLLISWGVLASRAHDATKAALQRDAGRSVA